MKILITGGAGFIGSAVVSVAIAREQPLLNLAGVGQRQGIKS